MHVTRRSLAVFLLFGLTALATTWASAQNQLAQDAELRKGHDKAMREGFPKLRSGEKQPAGGDKELMDAEARWLVWRFVSTPPRTPEQMNALRHDMELQINGALSAEPMKKNAAFLQQFGASLAEAYRKLFDNDFQEYRYPIVNAAPKLVDAAKLRSDAFGDFLAGLIADHDAAKGTKLSDKHDVIKMYAIRALREYYADVVRSDGQKVVPFAAKPIVPVEAGATLSNNQQKKLARDLRYVSVLLKFVENRPGASKLPYEEQDAIRALRCEAIETLAATQAPLVVYGKKTAEAPIAPFLLRVLSPKSDLEPAPSLAEKVEAAIGVCQMRYKNVEMYQPEIGIYLVGQLLAEFMTEANKDVGPISTGKVAPAMLWRLDARRLELALKDLVANAKGQPVEAKARQLEAAATPMLRDMAPLAAKSVVAINQGQLNTFRKTVMALRPASNEAFKDMPQSKIELGDQ